jgi:hypothetical protein
MKTTTETFMNFFWKTNAKKLNRPDGTWIVRHEKRMIKKVRSIWKKQERWVVEEMKSLSFLQTNTVNDEIENLLNQIPHKNELAEEIVAFMRVAIKRGGKKIVKDLDLKKRFGIGFDISNPAAKKFLEDKEDFEISNSDGNIDATTKKGLKRVLLEAHDEGFAYGKTKKNIQALAKAGVFSPARAQLIATREIGVAYEEGNSEVMNDFRSRFPARQVKKKWQTVNDQRVTPRHRENQNDGWVDYSFVFSGTDDQHAPGSDNPRCRCFTRYDIPAQKK